MSNQTLEQILQIQQQLLAIQEQSEKLNKIKNISFAFFGASAGVAILSLLTGVSISIFLELTLKKRQDSKALKEMFSISKKISKHLNNKKLKDKIIFEFDSINDITNELINTENKKKYKEFEIYAPKVIGGEKLKGLGIDLRIINLQDKQEIISNDTLKHSFYFPASPELQEKFKLDEKLKNSLLENNNQNILLHGSSGSGKTFFTNALEKYFLHHNKKYIEIKINTNDIFDIIKDKPIDSFKKGLEYLEKFILQLNNEINKDPKNQTPIIILFDEFDKFLNNNIFDGRMQGGDFARLSVFLDNIKGLPIHTLFTSNAKLEETKGFGSGARDANGRVILYQMFKDRLNNMSFEFKGLKTNEEAINFIEHELGKRLSQDQNGIAENKINVIREKNIKLNEKQINDAIFEKQMEMLYRKFALEFPHTSFLINELNQDIKTILFIKETEVLNNYPKTNLTQEEKIRIVTDIVSRMFNNAVEYKEKVEKIKQEVNFEMINLRKKMELEAGAVSLRDLRNVVLELKAPSTQNDLSSLNENSNLEK